MKSSRSAGAMKSMRTMKILPAPAMRGARRSGASAKAAEMGSKMAPILKKPSGFGKVLKKPTFFIDDPDDDTEEIIKKPAASGVAKVLAAIEKMKKKTATTKVEDASMAMRARKRVRSMKTMVVSSLAMKKAAVGMTKLVEKKSHKIPWTA